MNPEKKISILLLVSAPSGAGKTTLCDRLLHEDPGIQYSVSCTTRPPRSDEVNGEDYHFMNHDEFMQLVEKGEFLEFAEVHGAMYGTLKEHVQDIVSSGMDVLMDIDVQGAALVREQFDGMNQGAVPGIRYADIFIAAPSLEELDRRLRTRGLDQDEVIKTRLKNAEEETKHTALFDYLIINDDLEASYSAFRSILIAERHRLSV